MAKYVVYGTKQSDFESNSEQEYRSDRIHIRFNAAKEEAAEWMNGTSTTLEEDDRYLSVWILDENDDVVAEWYEEEESWVCLD